MEIIEQILNREIRAIGKAISRIENNDPQKNQIIDALYAHCGNATIIGVTGPPGAGKSTLVDKLIIKEREANHKVAVIAVDPSSPFSGGAILGDRLRMQNHAIDADVFIRSMASRGHLGGVAGATGDVIKVFDAAGYDTIIVETIGVGQTEIDIMDLADMVLLVLVPGMGDEIQALKAGVMEIGDVFVINKKDHDGADKLRAEVEYVLNFKNMDNQAVKNPVVMTAASLNEGIDELAAQANDYLERMAKTGRRQQKRKQRVITELKYILTERINREIEKFIHVETRIDTWAELVLQKHKSPYALVNETFNQFIKEQ